MSDTTIRLSKGDCDDLAYLLRLSIRVLNEDLDQDGGFPGGGVFWDYSETQCAQAQKILYRSFGILDAVLAARVQDESCEKLDALDHADDLEMLSVFRGCHEDVNEQNTSKAGSGHE